MSRAEANAGQLADMVKRVNFNDADPPANHGSATHHGDSRALVPYDQAQQPRSTRRGSVVAHNGAQLKTYAAPSYHPSRAGALVAQPDHQAPAATRTRASRRVSYVDPPQPLATLRSADTRLPIDVPQRDRISMIPRHPDSNWLLNNLWHAGLQVTPHDVALRTDQVCELCNDGTGGWKCRQMQREHEDWIARGKDYEHPYVSGLKERILLNNIKEEKERKEKQREEDIERGHREREREERGHCRKHCRRGSVIEEWTVFKFHG
jgi:hypothetical protein